jgi:hypothetical protein
MSSIKYKIIFCCRMVSSEQESDLDPGASLMSSKSSASDIVAETENE